jgi:hypothetical protein
LVAWVAGEVVVPREAEAVVVPREAAAAVVPREAAAVVVAWEAAAVAVVVACNDVGASVPVTVVVAVEPPQPATPIVAAASSAPMRLPVEPCPVSSEEKAIAKICCGSESVPTSRGATLSDCQRDVHRFTRST